MIDLWDCREQRQKFVTWFLLKVNTEQVNGEKSNNTDTSFSLGKKKTTHPELQHFLSGAIQEIDCFLTCYAALTDPNTHQTLVLLRMKVVVLSSVWALTTTYLFAQHTEQSHRKQKQTQILPFHRRRKELNHTFNFPTSLRLLSSMSHTTDGARHMLDSWELQKPKAMD